MAEDNWASSRVKGVSERELIIPTIITLASPEFADVGISVQELEPILRKIIRPAGHDLKIIPKRKDDFFSQKVRNLVSHRTLVKLGLAEFRTSGGIGRYFITPKGTYVAVKYAEKAGTDLGQLEPAQMVLSLGDARKVVNDIRDLTDWPGGLQANADTENNTC